MNIGIIGCGNISPIYFKNFARFGLKVAACADVFMSAAEKRGAEYNVPAVTVDQLLADPTIGLVLNITVPAAHGDVALQALSAGKHVYNEKPLALTRDQAKQMLALATSKNLRVGCAPDTFLGAGLQTCRRLIDEGAIGRPVAATAFMLGHGPEGWHPNPEFFYKIGAGPMFDMGPYYLTALVNLLGPVKRVTGSAQISFAERTIGSEPKKGQKIVVETPTHVVGVLDFAQGTVATLITSFDIWGHNLPRIEIYGSEGSLSCPDPNTFGGPIQIRKWNEKNWEDVPLDPGHIVDSRGLGPRDLIQAVADNRAHRASGALAYHVLDLMHAVHDASREGRHITLESTCDRPAKFTD